LRTIPAAAPKTLLVLVVISSCCLSPGKARAQETNPDRKPVIVELFTSEGCSSCPPADVLLQKLQDEQPLADAQVIALEEHVDYWNHDGWNDPYSSAEWTQRQLAYSDLFKAQAYTPQMVVDGQVQIVGSNTQDAALAIVNAVKRPETEVAVTREKLDAKGSQQLTVSIGKLTGNTPSDVAEVWLAVTEDGLESSVNRGENSGRVLHHAATLRSLHKIGVADPNKSPASFAGDPRVKFDSHWNAKNLRVVVFIQEKKSRKILGANSMKIAS
jgi:hypothetical protein